MASLGEWWEEFKATRLSGPDVAAAYREKQEAVAAEREKAYLAARAKLDIELAGHPSWGTPPDSGGWETAGRVQRGDDVWIFDHQRTEWVWRTVGKVSSSSVYHGGASFTRQVIISEAGTGRTLVGPVGQFSRVWCRRPSPATSTARYVRRWLTR